MWGLPWGGGVSDRFCLLRGLGVACFGWRLHFRVFDSGLFVSVSDGLSEAGAYPHACLA